MGTYTLPACCVGKVNITHRDFTEGRYSKLVDWQKAQFFAHEYSCFPFGSHSAPVTPGRCSVISGRGCDCSLHGGTAEIHPHQLDLCDHECLAC